MRSANPATLTPAGTALAAVYLLLRDIGKRALAEQAQ